MKKIYTLPELENMLTCRGEEENRLYSESKRIKNETIGNNVYLRGLTSVPKIVFIAASGNPTRKQPDMHFRTRKFLMLQTSPTHIISVPSCYRVANVPIKHL